MHGIVWGGSSVLGRGNSLSSWFHQVRMRTRMRVITIMTLMIMIVVAIAKSTYAAIKISISRSRLPGSRVAPNHHPSNSKAKHGVHQRANI